MMIDDRAERTIHAQVNKHAERLILKPRDAVRLVAASARHALRNGLGFQTSSFFVRGQSICFEKAKDDAGGCQKNDFAFHGLLLLQVEAINGDFTLIRTNAQELDVVHARF